MKKERDLAQKQCIEAQKERDLAVKQCRESHAQFSKAKKEVDALLDELKKDINLAQKERNEAQKQCSEAQKLCSEAQKQCSELHEQGLHMCGFNIDDFPEQKLEILAEDIEEAKKRVKATILRRRAEDRVLAKNPDYKCPISLALMRDPVMADDGQSYERKEIEAWFKTLSEANEPITSPLRAPLESAKLATNHSLRRAIEAAVRAEEPNCARLVGEVVAELPF